VPPPTFRSCLARGGHTLNEANQGCNKATIKIEEGQNILTTEFSTKTPFVCSLHNNSANLLCQIFTCCESVFTLTVGLLPSVLDLFFKS